MPGRSLVSGTVVGVAGARSERGVQARADADQRGRRGFRGGTELGRRVADPRPATARCRGHAHGRRTTAHRKFHRRDAHARNRLRVVHIAAGQQRAGRQRSHCLISADLISAPTILHVVN